MTNFRFLRPLKDSEAVMLGMILGYRKGNTILTEFNKVIGCSCDEKDEKDIIKWAHKYKGLLPEL